MKISELTNKKPHLYLDMDGVQADFFGAWARLMGHTDYKQIGDRAAREASIRELSARGPEYIERFFATLPLLRGGHRIIKWLNDNNIDYTVLTAPMINNEEASKKGKAVWLKKHNPAPPVIYSGEKYRYAVKDGVPAVLVDDYGKYVNSWRDAGGIAVKHSDNTVDKTIAQLEKIYQPWL